MKWNIMKRLKARLRRGKDKLKDSEKQPGKAVLTAKQMGESAARAPEPTRPEEGKEQPQTAAEEAAPNIENEEKSIFLFLSLPAELRLQIYRLLFISHEPVDFPCLPAAKPLVIKLPLSAQFLLTCRKIYYEGMQVLYGENTWRLKLLGWQWIRPPFVEPPARGGNWNEANNNNSNSNSNNNNNTSSSTTPPPPPTGWEIGCKDGAHDLVGLCPGAFRVLVPAAGSRFGFWCAPFPPGEARQQHPGLRLIRKFRVVIGEGYRVGEISAWCVSERLVELACELEMLCDLLQSPRRVPEILYLGLEFKTLGCRPPMGSLPRDVNTASAAGGGGSEGGTTNPRKFLGIYHVIATYLAGRIRNVRRFEVILPPKETREHKCEAILHRTAGVTGLPTVIPRARRILGISPSYEGYLRKMVRSDTRKSPLTLMWPVLRHFMDKEFPGVPEMLGQALDAVLRNDLEGFKAVREDMFSAGGKHRGKLWEVMNRGSLLASDQVFEEEEEEEEGGEEEDGE